MCAQQRFFADGHTLKFHFASLPNVEGQVTSQERSTRRDLNAGPTLCDI